MSAPHRARARLAGLPSRSFAQAALLLLSAGTGLVGSASGQTLGEIRDDLRAGLRQTKFVSSLAGLILLSEELELSGAKYDIGTDASTEVSSIVFPFTKAFTPFEQSGLALYTEGVIGYAHVDEQIADFYGGALPDLETSVDAEWTSFSAFAGAGPRFDVTRELTVAAVLSLGLARLESDADYGGPGAAPSSALFDGVAFNWEAWAVNYGGALRLDWEHSLGERRTLSLLSRYDCRWTSTFDADDPVQEFTSLLQVVTLRAEYGAPTGWTVRRMPLDYALHLGLRRLVDGDVFGVKEIGELGGSLEVLTGDGLPIATGVNVGGSVFFGDDLSGWTIGVGLSF